MMRAERQNTCDVGQLRQFGKSMVSANFYKFCRNYLAQAARLSDGRLFLFGNLTLRNQFPKYDVRKTRADGAR